MTQIIILGKFFIQKELYKLKIYDDVITCSPGWIFIIKNKPSRQKIW